MKKPAFITPPYSLTREEFNYYRELYRPDGASQHKFTRGAGNKAIQHHKIMDWLEFGVQNWLHEKALAGDKDALTNLELGYDLYDMVLKKAKEL